MNITVSENIKQRFENIKLWLADIMMAHSVKYGQVPDRDDATHHTAHTPGTEGQWSIWCMYYVLSLQFFGFELLCSDDI